MDTSAPELFVWTDQETTGLIAHQEHLLEVACLVTDINLNLLDDAGFHRVIRYDQVAAASMRNAADPFVQDMHDTSGLWEQLPSGAPLESVDADLLAYVMRFAPQPRQARFAGNSLRLDMNFTDQWLPRTAAHMHYRFLDVSGIAYLANKWSDVPYMTKARNHEAMADVRESLAELRHLHAHGVFPARD